MAIPVIIQAVGADGRHDMPPLSSPVGAEAPRAAEHRGNVAAVYHGQHVATPTAATAWRANMAVSKAPWWLDLLTLKVVSESCVTQPGYFCANFGFLDLSVLDVGRDRRQTDSIMA